MAGRTHEIHFQHSLGQDLVLNAEVVVVNVRIINSLGEDDSREQCKVGIQGIPAVNITLGLRPDRSLALSVASS